MGTAQHAPDSQRVDVLIVGGGPVGLVTAYQLAQTLPPPHRVKIIEQYPKSAQDQYGRAITLFPRSSEMLDQLGLAEELAQQCFACRTTVAYDRHGREVEQKGRGAWDFMENMKDTIWEFPLVLRQKYQEDIFRQALRRQGVTLDAPVELVDVAIDEAIPAGGYRVLAILKDGVTGAQVPYRCKYLIGADGGRSFVRRALTIPFDGSMSEDKWVRVDGIIETDMPKPRSYCAIESPTHGNVLWAALDHGATRIGFAFTAERQKAYPNGFNEEAAVKEAIASVKPFNLKFKQVDWYTIYVVGQRVARHFFFKDAVFLAGDACHTHSSGAAQGMNTGMHDAVNLGWKLSLVLKGLATPKLLETYESERLPNVQKLINYDKDISRLMTMQLPEGWKGDPDADPNEILGVKMAEAATFSSGLGIFYEPDGLLNRPGSLHQSSPSSQPVAPGHRAPDVQLRKPATFEPTRLHRESPNAARFHVVIFAGNPARTRNALTDMCISLQSSPYLNNTDLPVSWLTIATETDQSAYELLGGEPIGKVFYDTDCTAHMRYGVDVGSGGCFVIRPDGWIGTATVLDGGAVTELETYFGDILKSMPTSRATTPLKAML